MKKLYKLIILVLVITAFGCLKRDDANPRPRLKADFYIQNDDNLFSFQEVKFINQSENADSCFWLFGDDSTSFVWNPIHVYTKEGDYQVTLTVFNEDDNQETSKSITIHGKSNILIGNKWAINEMTISPSYNGTNNLLSIIPEYDRDDLIEFFEDGSFIEDENYLKQPDTPQTYYGTWELINDNKLILIGGKANNNQQFEIVELTDISFFTKTNQMIGSVNYVVNTKRSPIY